MKIELSRAVVAVSMCLMALAFAGSARADEVQEVTQELISGLDIPADVAEYVVNGQGTLGERLQAAVDNGSLSQEKHHTITNRFLELPEHKRQLIKNSWDNVGSDKISGVLSDLVHPDGRALKDHIKDLRAQGFNRDQIAERLRNEGVSPDHLKALGVIPGTPSRPGHAKDVRDAGEQHKVDRGHEKYQDKKFEGSRPDHAKDRPQGTKSVRDTRKDVRQGQDVRERRNREGADSRDRDAGVSRGTTGRR